MLNLLLIILRCAKKCQRKQVRTVSKTWMNQMWLSSYVYQHVTQTSWIGCMYFLKSISFDMKLEKIDSNCKFLKWINKQWAFQTGKELGLNSLVGEIQNRVCFVGFENVYLVVLSSRVCSRGMYHSGKLWLLPRSFLGMTLMNNDSSKCPSNNSSTAKYKPKFHFYFLFWK